MLLWNHIRGNRRNLLFAGPTGCGKTEIFRQLQKLYPYIIMVDGSRISKDGWKGDYRFSSIFNGLDDEAEKAIVVIEEADKMFEPVIGSSGTDYSKSLQTELLKLMEGDIGTISAKREGRPR